MFRDILAMTMSDFNFVCYDFGVGVYFIGHIVNIFIVWFSFSFHRMSSDFLIARAVQFIGIFVHLFLLLVLLHIVFVLLSQVNGAQCANHVLVQNLLELLFNHFLLLLQRLLFIKITVLRRWGRWVATMRYLEVAECMMETLLLLFFVINDFKSLS